MEIHVSQGECESPFADRSGLADPSRDMREGFELGFGGVRFHFEDERDAVTLAKAVLLRMGQLTVLDAYGSPCDLAEYDVTRLAYEYRNTHDRHLLGLIVDELQRRDQLYVRFRELLKEAESALRWDGEGFINENLNGNCEIADRIKTTLKGAPEP